MYNEDEMQRTIIDTVTESQNANTSNVYPSLRLRLHHYSMHIYGYESEQSSRTSGMLMYSLFVTLQGHDFHDPSSAAHIVEGPVHVRTSGIWICSCGIREDDVFAA
jgi:hypothetical protein